MGYNDLSKKQIEYARSLGNKYGFSVSKASAMFSELIALDKGQKTAREFFVETGEIVPALGITREQMKDAYNLLYPDAPAYHTRRYEVLIEAYETLQAQIAQAWDEARAENAQRETVVEVVAETVTESNVENTETPRQYVTRSLCEAGVPYSIASSITDEEVKILNRHTFYKRMLNGGYYNEVTPTGIRDCYGAIWTWGELTGDESNDYAIAFN